ncbi:MAG: ribonuclease P protein component [Bacilli bacterium]|nr:ribonuclease P protein component [Bacilli bacterium]
MKKINILKNNYEYTSIIKSSKPIKYKYFIIYLKNEPTDYYKFGISIGKKIGNAVIRNKIKRQLKNIIDKKDYQNNFKCIIIVSKDILKYNFTQIENDLLNAFSKIKIIKGE